MGAGASSSSRDGPPTADELETLSKVFLGPQRLFVINGLTSATGEQLNGRLGEVMHVDKGTGRLAVRMLPGDSQANWKLLRHPSLSPSPLQVLEGGDICCSICLEDATSLEDGVLVRACSCRGSSGATHIGCCLKAYAAARKSKAHSHFPACPTCKSQYHPKVAVTLLLAHAAAQQAHTSTASGSSGGGGGDGSGSDGGSASVINPSTAPAAPLEFGALVRIHSLSTAVHLNGRRGLVIERDARSSEGRWLVQLDGGVLLAIREANLVRQSVHSDGVVRDGADGTGGVEAALVAAQARQAEEEEGAAGLLGVAGVANAARLLGMAYHAAGQPAMALRSLRESVSTSESAYGPGHPSVALALASLGTALLDQRSSGGTREAIECLERALQIHETAAAATRASSNPDGGGSGEASYETIPVPTLLALARAYRLRGDAPAGHALLLRCLAASEARAASSSSGAGFVGVDGGTASAGSTAAAISSGSAAAAATAVAATTVAAAATATSSSAAATASPPRSHPGKGGAPIPREAAEALAVVLEELATSEASLANDAARAAVDECCSELEDLMRRMAAGESSGAEGLPIPEVAADAKRRAGAHGAARHLERALELRERTYGPRHEALVGLLHRLGEMWIVAGEPRNAAGALERAVDLALSVGAGGAGPAAVAGLLSQLRVAYQELGETAKAEQAEQRATALRREESSSRAYM